MDGADRVTSDIGTVLKMSVVIAILSMLVGCGQAAEEASDGSPPAGEVSSLTEVDPLFEAARRLLVKGGLGRKLDWERAEPGSPLPIYVYSVPAASRDPWTAVPSEPAEYIVPIAIDGAPVAEFLVTADAQGKGWHTSEAAVGASDWTAITLGVEKVRVALGEDAPVRVLSGGWTAVIGRSAGGEVAVSFCLPRVGLHDSRLTKDEEEALSIIEEQHVYRGLEATRRIRDAFPLAFRVDSAEE